MVDWDGLENRCASDGTVGSNPTLSSTSLPPTRRRASTGMQSSNSGEIFRMAYESGRLEDEAEVVPELTLSLITRNAPRLVRIQNRQFS